MPGTRRGYATEKPVCGRKHCNVCGRWRHVLDFTPTRRAYDGSVSEFRPSCRTCTRRAWHEKHKHGREMMERKREYDRIRQEALRRARGARPRNFKRPRGPVEREYERIPNGPLREAFLASGMTASELAREAGYIRKSLSGNRRSVLAPDDKVVKLMLGMVPGKRDEPLQKTIAYKHAVRLVRAMGLTPADYGV